MRAVICGCGVIGASAAYFLSRRGAEVAVVERVGVAHAASGKSGGFLALDWCDGTPLQQLARRSFMLHAQLAQELGGDWCYRRLHTYGGFARAARARRGRADGGGAPALGWLSENVRIAARLGTPETTAQVHPGAFTAALLNAAQAKGATLRLGEITGIATSADGGRIAGVEVDGAMVRGDAFVFALGPWSRHAAEWLPLPRVFGRKGHSLVFDTGTKIPAEALFLEFEEESGEVLTPEFYPRADGTTYVSAVSSELPAPADPAAVAPDPAALQRLAALVRDVAPLVGESRILAGQACFRPITDDGLPLIGPVPGPASAYVATGHSVWGILNAPATGEALAELLLDGAAHNVDLSPFDPGRLPLAGFRQKPSR